MHKAIRLFIQNKKTWINNLIYMFYSIILLVIVVQIDSNSFGIKDHIPDIFFTGVDLARDIMTAMAAALLSIATFTFSIILTVIGSYASNMTPRVVENFIENRITMKVLGIFIGGFFYSIIMLQFMRYSEHETKIIAGTVAIFYAMFCIIYLVRFIQFVISNIQVGKTTSKIRDNAMALVLDDLKERTQSSIDIEMDDEHLIKILATETGYLNFVSEEDVFAWMEQNDAVKLDVHVNSGDYIVKRRLIATLCTGNQTLDAETLQKLSDGFAIQDRKADENDYHYSMVKLVEIALRAISPGVNDPNTAINCIRKLSQILAKLASAESDFIYHEKNGRYICYHAISIKDELYQVFHQIVHYGEDDVSVVHAILEALDVVLLNASDHNRSIVYEFATHYYERLIKRYEDEYDQAYLNAKYDDLHRHMNQLSS